MMKSTLCAILLLASPAFATIAQQRAASKWTCSGTVTGGMLQCQQSFATTGANDLIAVWWLAHLYVLCKGGDLCCLRRDFIFASPY
jgi:hypothetical protein